MVNMVYLKTKAYILNGLKKLHSTDIIQHATLLVYIIKMMINRKLSIGLKKEWMYIGKNMEKKMSIVQKNLEN